MQIINQSFRVRKISRAKPLYETVVNWFDDGNRFSAMALLAQRAGEANGSTQLQWALSRRSGLAAFSVAW